MKKLILIVICLISLQLTAQGNLQFNQVKNISFSANVGAYTAVIVGTITVPVNTVWKVEHCSAYWLNGAYRRSISGRPSVYFGENLIISGTSGGTVNQFEDRFPIWLSSGTYDVIISNEYSSAYDYTTTLSAIEFNVVP